jgi:uncharacterized protein YcnI
MSFFRAALVAASLALCTSAQAHIVADPDEGPEGGYSRVAFRVPHGCKGSPTTAITIQLPHQMIQAKPMVKPGWTIEIKMRALPEPVDSGHGFKIREAVSEVTWKGGRLENAHFDEFVLSMKLPTGNTGDIVYFPTIQTCEVGKTEWKGIPTGEQKWHDLPEPAPYVRLKKAGQHAHH